jgi:putative membrane protein
MKDNNRVFYVWNGVITLAAMSFLVWLIYFRESGQQATGVVKMLPAVNAGLNATCTVLLCLGYRAVKNQQEALHRTFMLAAFVVSALFLACYVYYHSIHGDTKFLGQGWIRPLYFFVLISHIVLSMVVFPMILSSIFFGLTNRRRLHRKVVRYTLPAWLYVSVTGVLLFFMLRYLS